MFISQNSRYQGIRTQNPVFPKSVLTESRNLASPSPTSASMPVYNVFQVFTIKGKMNNERKIIKKGRKIREMNKRREME